MERVFRRRYERRIIKFTEGDKEMEGESLQNEIQIEGRRVYSGVIEKEEESLQKEM